MMRIRMVCLEDGITSCGFRRMAAWAARLNEDTESFYVSTNRLRSPLRALMGRIGGAGALSDDAIDEIAQGLAGADLVGLSSMTGYSDLTRRVIARLRAVAPDTFILWGGIHPIMHPEDAISSEVDAICNGEGEFAFEQLVDALVAGREPGSIRNMWFKRGGEVERNPFLPLMTPAEMETLPFPQYGGPERIYREGHGFVEMGLGDYLATNGLAYNTIWSIGCPFHCTFCGNTKFIANDRKYSKIRHPSAERMVEEVAGVRRRFPHVSSVTFHDDSFMAIPLRELERFAEAWKSGVGLPFAVAGVIPNYVDRRKFEVLTWAGMNRIRMGVQSGSQRILDFYKRPTPPEKVLAASSVNASFAPRYHIPPAYDVIMDNPIETRDDVLDTLELVYRLARPFTLLIYSLKIIPNTELERQLRERGVDIEQISSSYLWVPPRWANLMLYLLALWRPPRPLFDRLLRRVRASNEPQPTYPVLAGLLRFLYLSRRVFNHVRFMDFSIIPGRAGWLCWRVGLVGFWQRHLTPRPGRPAPARPRVPQAAAAVGR